MTPLIRRQLGGKASTKGESNPPAQGPSIQPPPYREMDGGGIRPPPIPSQFLTRRRIRAE